MAGLLAKAKARKEPAADGGSKKRKTIWLVGDPNRDVDESIGILKQLSADQKAINAKMGIHKGVVKRYAESAYLEEYAERGVSPEAPMVVQNHDGDQVTFVVQDRSGSCKVKEEQIEALGQLLGADRAQDVLYEETTFSLNRDILAMPGVTEAVEKALETALGKLQKNGTLSEDQADMLLQADTHTAFKPGTLSRLGLICGRDTMKMRQFLELMDSAAVRYVKP